MNNGLYVINVRIRGDQENHKLLSPLIPTVGDDVVIKDDTYEVKQVTHTFLARPNIDDVHSHVDTTIRVTKVG